MAGRADLAPLPPGLRDYRFGESWDEALKAPGVPREHYADLLEALAGADLAALEVAVAGEVAARGVTFGSGAAPFRLDAIPRIVPAEEWAALKRGLAQRMRALGAFLADLHGSREIVAAGRIPERVLETAESQEPDAAEAANVRAWAPVAGLDVIRGVDGRFAVLEDNLRTPSGLAYAAEAREVLVRRLGIEPPPLREVAEPAVSLLGDTLRAAAPAGDGDPAVVLLSDGPVNSAWFEHDWLARRLGVPLVRLADLEVRGGALFRRDEDGGRRQVDVVYRRTDEDRLTGEDGELTPVGAVLAEPWRRGNVACVNAFGTGVADDKLVHAYVERWFASTWTRSRSSPPSPRMISPSPNRGRRRSTGWRRWW